MPPDAITEQTKMMKEVLKIPSTHVYMYMLDYLCAIVNTQCTCALYLIKFNITNYRGIIFEISIHTLVAFLCLYLVHTCIYTCMYIADTVHYSLFAPENPDKTFCVLKFTL